MFAFALLDERTASRERPTSRIYTGFLRKHCCTDPAMLDASWAAIEAEQRAGAHALLLADYEWGAKLLRASHVRLAPDDGAALRVPMFATLEGLSCCGRGNGANRTRLRTCCHARSNCTCAATSELLTSGVGLTAERASSLKAADLEPILVT